MKPQIHAYIPRAGDQFRVLYVDGCERKDKDFTDLQEALNFYCLQGPGRACLLLLTVSGNVKAKLDLTPPA